jgi:ABC-type sugar transport system substrate-binding protein
MKGDYYDKIQEGAQKAIREKSGLNCAFKSYFFSRGPFAEEKEREIIDKIILSQGKGLDGIVIIPISSSSVIRGAINKIISLGIPVVTIDNNFEEVQTLCSVAPDSSAIGEIAAEFLDTIHLPKGKILLACGSKDSANHQKDAQGFLSYLAFRKEMYEIDIIEDGKSKEDFYQRCKQYLSENDDLVAYYTVRERNTIPFCQAVIDASKQGALVIIGSDLLPAHIEMLKQGILTVILHKNPFQRGYLAMKVLSDFLIKKVNPEDKELTVPINLVLKSNVQFFKDE